MDMAYWYKLHDHILQRCKLTALLKSEFGHFWIATRKMDSENTESTNPVTYNVHAFCISHECTSGILCWLGKKKKYAEHYFGSSCKHDVPSLPTCRQYFMTLCTCNRDKTADGAVYMLSHRLHALHGLPSSSLLCMYMHSAVIHIWRRCRASEFIPGVNKAG